MSTAAAARALVPVVLALGLAACDQPLLTDQPKYEVYEAAEGWPEDRAARRPPLGTVAREAPADATAEALPVPMTLALLERGRDRYGVFCTPCHDLTGRGAGSVVRHGFPSPPSLHQPRLRRLPLPELVRIVDEGYGRMAGYGERIPPRDRWAVAAYVRALQRSQHVPVDRLDPDARARLEAEASP